MTSTEAVATALDQPPPPAARKQAERRWRNARPLPARPVPADLPDRLHPGHAGLLPHARRRATRSPPRSAAASPPTSCRSASTQAGYDRPIIVQYLEYLGQVLHRQLRHAPSPTTSRSPMCCSRYGTATLELAFYALIVAFIVGIPLGMVAASLRDRWPDAVPARVRDPLLRDPGVLRRPRAQADLLGLAGLAPGARPRGRRGPSSPSTAARERDRHLPDRRDPARQRRVSSATCSCTPCCRRSRWVC